MRKLLPILLLLVSASVFAQQPFGYHATWYYYFSEYGYTGYKKVTHVNDTNMHGMNWLTFEITGLSELRTGPGPNDLMQDTNAYFGKTYLATRNDSVFRLQTDGTPYLLYDFDSNIGDSWQFSPLDTIAGCYAVPEATVTAKGTTTVGGAQVDYVDIDLPMDTILISNTPTYQPVCSATLPERIYPQFGGLSYGELFQPSPNLCDGSVFLSSGVFHQLRCFSNDNISFNLTGKACDSWSLLSVAENQLAGLKIYPNPTNGKISMESTLAVRDIAILDIYGQLIAQYGAVQNIELKAPSGTYLLQINFEDGSHAVHKLVKQ